MNYIGGLVNDEFMGEELDMFVRLDLLDWCIHYHGYLVVPLLLPKEMLLTSKFQSLADAVSISVV